MKTWELIKWCASGAYIGGETFINEYGQELYFDGKQLIGIEKVELNSTWEYVDQKTAS